MPLPTGPLAELATKLGRGWPSIEAGFAGAAAAKGRLEGIDGLFPLSADRSLVVFGSLARGEWTSGSDLDWTILVDGQVSPEDVAESQRVSEMLGAAQFKDPARAGPFGRLAFSHELVNQIGGETDLNSNTTRRILLLLESESISDGAVRERVIRGALDRYIGEDAAFRTRNAQESRIPRFLLNDIVRFWRTMAVDYASKNRERKQAKWALRNAKLRLSRKLIFASGLLICFSCKLEPSPELMNEDLGEGKPHLALLNHLYRQLSWRPLEILASAAGRYASVETAGQLFDSYDEFLKMIGDPAGRAKLERLGPGDWDDPLFAEVRRLGRSFHNGLCGLFFDGKGGLSELTRTYGVF